MGDYIKDKLLDFIKYLQGEGRQENDYHWEEWDEDFIHAIGDPFLKEKLRELYGEMPARERQAQ